MEIDFIVLSFYAVLYTGEKASLHKQMNSYDTKYHYHIMFSIWA